MHQRSTETTAPRAPGHSGEFNIYPVGPISLLQAPYGGDIRTPDWTNTVACEQPHLRAIGREGVWWRGAGLAASARPCAPVLQREPARRLLIPRTANLGKSRDLVVTFAVCDLSFQVQDTVLAVSDLRQRVIARDQSDRFFVWPYQSLCYICLLSIWNNFKHQI